MGKNVCQIEQYAAGALPVIHNPSAAPKGPNDLYPGEAGCGSSLGDRVSDALSPKNKYAVLGAVALAAGAVAVLLYIRNKNKRAGM
jgi:hypothetical protein